MSWSVWYRERGRGIWTMSQWSTLDKLAAQRIATVAQSANPDFEYMVREDGT